MAEDEVRAAFERLDKAIRSGNMTKVLAMADQVLNLAKDDKDAIHCKIVALVQAGHFQKALDAISATSHSASFAYEQAYSHYGLKDFGKAVAVVDAHLAQDNAGSPFRYLELKAQALYRLEQGQECLSIYMQLTQEATDDRHEERQTNYLAAAVLAQVPEAKTSDGCYEEAYNSACWLLTQKQPKPAMDMLDKATALCQEYFDQDPDATEEEIANSLALLECQRVVALHQLGEREQAMTSYKHLLKTVKGNASVTAVACTNIIALHGAGDVFDSKKRLKTASADAIMGKMTRRQRLALQANAALLHLYAGNFKSCVEACQQLEKDFPSNPLAGLIHAATVVKDKNVQNPVAEIAALRKTYTDSDALLLVQCQAALKAGQSTAVPAILANRLSVLHSPALVGYRVANETTAEQAQHTLSTAIAYWRDHQTEENTELKTLLKVEAKRRMAKQDYKQAVEPLEEVVSLDPEDASALAELVLALTHVDVKQAEQYADSLPAVQLVDGSDLNVDELEAAATLRVNKFKSKRETELPSLATPGATATAVKAKRKTRKRPGKPAQDYHPDKTPDAERWLKKSERSTFGGKKKKKHQAQQFFKGSQGDAESTASAASQLDASLRQAPTEATKPSSAKSKKKPVKGKKKRR